METLCTGTRDDGNRCTRHRAAERETCRWHHPEVLEEKARRLEAAAARVRGVAVPA